MDAGLPGTMGLAMFKVAVLMLSLMIAAYPVYRVVCMWLDKSLEAHEAVLYLGALVMLLLGIIAGWGTPVGWLLLFALIALCLGLPLLNRAADKAALRRMEDADIRSFTATLERQPKNTYLRERLARIMLSRKQYEPALVQLDLALQALPKDRQLERLRERVETERRRAVEHLKVCPKCATENREEAGICVKCGFLFVDPADFFRLLATPPALQAAKWGGLGMLALGLLLIALQASLLIATVVLFFAILSIFWYGYVYLSRA